MNDEEKREKKNARDRERYHADIEKSRRQNRLKDERYYSTHPSVSDRRIKGKVYRFRGHWCYRGRGRIPVHRVIVERVLGRPLLSSEHVHHLDGNGFNNRHSNLLVCSRKYHSWLEKKMAAIGKELVFGR